MIERIDVNHLMSQVIKYGDKIETSGQVADDPSADIRGQTEQVLAKISQLLKYCHADESQLVRIQIWLADIDDFTAMNEVYEKWLCHTTKPVRACIESTLVSGGYKIEVQAFAWSGK